jgi:hypothetical protein
MKLSDDTKVALVTAICLLAIALLFRSVIQKPMDLLVAIVPFFLFFIYLITRGQAKKSGGSQAKIWNIVISLVTFLIILIFAIR